ncbi:GHKL domain-containing protein [Niastella caeni]|uniref:GHKL domain-containing protein n=1 Tax=Niastella caeni TaxID=2569763 RepID=A0A4S8HS11_9BACT|nr:histidine kinase [Niastella caeni]THU35882.1 GHKL domain-containing protein [Niastella caeni]
MKTTRFIQRYYLHHLLGWGLLFLGWHFFRYQDYPAGKGWYITFIKVADLALMVYITNYLLIPRLLYKKRYFLFAITFIALVFTFSITKMYVEAGLLNISFDIWDRFKVRVYDNVIPHFLLVSTGAAIKLLIDYAGVQRRLGEMAKEKAETELNFLKSQINPHFLFNSLNTIYFLIDKQNSDARTTLLQMSDLLRYQLYDCNNPTIEIEKEVHYLQDYIRLQELRKDQQYEVGIEVGEQVKGFRITPLLLIPFVENAFKHISHYSHEKNFIKVNLQRQNGTLTFIVENSKDDQQRSTEPKGGIGLSNVKRRLELLYPGKHTLQISNNPHTFKIELNLHLS